MFHKTLLEVKRCTRENIVINTLMLESNDHLVQFVNQMTRLNRGGRSSSARTGWVTMSSSTT